MKKEKEKEKPKNNSINIFLITSVAALMLIIGIIIGHSSFYNSNNNYNQEEADNNTINNNQSNETQNNSQTSKNKSYNVEIYDEDNSLHQGKYRIVDEEKNIVLDPGEGYVLSIIKSGDYSYFLQGFASKMEPFNYDFTIYNKNAKKIIYFDNNDAFSEYGYEFNNDKIHLAYSDKIVVYNYDGTKNKEYNYKEVFGIVNNYAFAINQDNYLEVIDLKTEKNYIYKTQKNYTIEYGWITYLQFEHSNLVSIATSDNKLVSFNLETKEFKIENQ